MKDLGHCSTSWIPSHSLSLMLSFLVLQVIFNVSSKWPCLLNPRILHPTTCLRSPSGCLSNRHLKLERSPVKPVVLGSTPPCPLQSSHLPSLPHSVNARFIFVVAQSPNLTVISLPSLLFDPLCLKPQIMENLIDFISKYIQTPATSHYLPLSKSWSSFPWIIEIVSLVSCFLPCPPVV